MKTQPIYTALTALLLCILFVYYCGEEPKPPPSIDIFNANSQWTLKTINGDTLQISLPEMYKIGEENAVRVSIIHNGRAVFPSPLIIWKSEEKKVYFQGIMDSSSNIKILPSKVFLFNHDNMGGMSETQVGIWDVEAIEQGTIMVNNQQVDTQGFRINFPDKSGIQAIEFFLNGMIGIVNVDSTAGNFTLEDYQLSPPGALSSPREFGSSEGLDAMINLYESMEDGDSLSSNQGLFTDQVMNSLSEDEWEQLITDFENRNRLSIPWIVNTGGNHYQIEMELIKPSENITGLTDLIHLKVKAQIDSGGMITSFNIDRKSLTSE